MSETIFRLMAMSTVYGLLIGGCLWGIALLASGEEFPLLYQQVLLFAVLFAAGTAWHLLIWSARRLNPGDESR